MIVNGILNRPRVTLALTALFVMTGCLCMWNLPVEKFPSVTPPAFRIKAAVKGMDARDADALVALPILKYVSEMPDVLYHSSMSVGDGECRCDVTFRAGTDEELALWRLRDAVRSAQSHMPAEVVQSGVAVLRNVDDVVLMCAIGSSSGDGLSAEAVFDLKTLILAQEGVEGVEIEGTSGKMLRVVLDPVKLAALGISVADVARVLESHRPETGLFGPSQGSALRVDGFKMSVSELEDVVIRGDSRTGGRVMLKNIGCVVYSERPIKRTSLDGNAVTVFKVRKRPDANASDTAGAVSIAVKKYLDGKDDINCTYILDASSDVKSFLRDVALAPCVALLLVAVVLYLFWRSLREVMVPISVVAVSIVGSFVFQSLLGFTFNALTLFGFMLVIGSLVDDALVVIEMARSDRSVRKLSAKDAMSAAVRRSFDVLIVSTGISAVCYLPLVFVRGMASGMYLQFAFTSCIALALSAVFAATLAPVLFVALVRTAPARQGGRDGVLHWLARKWRLVWHRATGFWTARPWFAVVFLVMAACSFVAFRQMLPKTLFGDAGTDKVIVEVVRLGEGSATDADRLGDEIVSRLKRLDGVGLVFAENGRGALSGGGERFLKLTVGLDRVLSATEIDGFIREVRNVTADMSGLGVSVLVPSPVQGVGSFAGLEFHLCGSSGATADLASAARDFAAKIRELDGVAEVVTPSVSGVYRVKLSVDAAKAEAAGVSSETAVSVLKGRFEPKVIGKYALSEGVFDIELSEFAELGADADEVSRMLLPVSGGGLVPASSLGTVTEEFVPDSVERFGGRRAASCVVRLTPSATPEKVVRAISALSLPEGVRLEWSGVALQESVNRGGTRIMIALSLLFAYLLLVAWYESWVLPLPSVGTAVIAVFGSLIGLYLAGEPLDYYAQVALVAVVGIALKGSSLIVDAIRDEYEKGRSLRASVAAGAVRVFRPVQMTIWTSLFGVVPFLFAFGVKMSAQRVLGVVAVSGVLTVLLCGFSLTPALYIVAEKLHALVSKKPFRARRRRLWKTGDSSGIAGKMKKD